MSKGVPMSSNVLLNVLDIYLDTENPRHDPIEEQGQIIEHLLLDERVKNLAKHMASYGVNPLDLIGVVKDEDDNYVVVEGNRRLCALLLLNDPNKAPSSDVNFFKKLAQGNSNIPTAINCVLFDSPEEANIWMGVRHNGEQDGVGIRGWDAKQKTRHNGKINKKDTNALALTFLDYAIRKGILPDEKNERIITTATRYLGNPFIRETFGIVSSRSEKDVIINVSCTDFDAVVARFCADLIENTTVNSRTRRDDWVTYGRLLIEQSIAPKNRISPHRLLECLSVDSSKESNSPVQSLNNTPPSDGTNGQPAATAKDGITNTGKDADDQTTSKQDGNANSNSLNPDKRKYIIPNDFRVHINHKIIRRAFEEMRTIPVDEKPLAIALVTRAFLENLYIIFIEKVTGHYKPQATHILIDKAIKEIQKDANLSKAEKDSLAALARVQSNQLNVLSPKTLGANAHAGIYPNPTELKREFDNISAVIKYMLKRI